MGYYVTILKGGDPNRAMFAAGPFNRHGDAQNAVGHVRRLAHEMFANDRDLPWAGWGTSRVKSGPMPVGKFNVQLGLPEGRIAESTLTPNRWWIEGENDWRRKPVRGNYDRRYGQGAIKRRYRRAA